MTVTPWEAFAAEVRDALAETTRLEAVEDPEATPFKSKEAALQLVEAVLTKLQQQFVGDGASDDVATMEAELRLRAGMLAVDTEDPGKGTPLIEQAVAHLSRAPQRHAAWLQEAHNALGVVWSGRSEYQKAAEHLQKAEAAYDACTLRSSNPEGEAPVASAKHYLQTCFYLAQVYGQLGQGATSAEYCVRTLNLQLAHRDEQTFNQADWAQNAAQLCGFYLSSSDYASADRCLAAAQWALDHHSQAGQEMDDVAANVCLARAKLYGQQLREGSESCLRGTPGRPSGDPDARTSAPVVRFDALPLSPPSPLVGRLPGCWAEAVAVFNAAMAESRRAAQYYQLDGFVTEHVQLLQDCAELYKHLAVYEEDTHRKCVLHKKRTVPLEKVLGSLNPKVYSAFYKEIAFMLGEAYRTILELKSNARRPHGKLLAAGGRAARFYAKYVAAVEETHAGAPTHRVGDDEEHPYLNARFLQARVHQTMQRECELAGVPVDVGPLCAALQAYSQVVEYTKLHPQALEHFGQETEICRQMIELLPTKIEALRLGRLIPTQGPTIFLGP